MDTQGVGVAKRLLFSLAAAAALSGCAVYGPPYAAYDAAPVAVPSAPYYYYPYAYRGPAYVGPPLSLNFGYYEHRYRGGYGGYHGGYRGYRGHGGHGWGGRGWRGGYHGGGHGGGRGRR